MRELVRHRDFRLLLTAQTLSMAGDWALLLVFGIWVKTLTGSSAMAGLTIFAMAAPTLCAPIGAVVVDRMSRRRVIVAASVFSAVVVSSLWFVRGPGQVWLLFVVAAYYGLISVLINAAVSALVQEMLPRELIGTANGALATVRQGLRLIAPLIGAGVFVLAGGWWVATLDAATFLGAAAVVARMRFVERSRSSTSASFLSDAVAGVRHARADAVLRRWTVTLAIAFGAVGLTEAAVFALVDQGLHEPPGFISVLSTTQGVGAVVAGLVITAVISRLREQVVLLVGLVGIALGVALEAIASTVVVLAGFVCIGAALPVVSVGLATLLQHRTPNHLMGRVAVAFEVVTSTPYTVMIAVSALLVGVLPYQLLFAGAAAGCGLAALLAVPTVVDRAGIGSPWSRSAPHWHDGAHVDGPSRTGAARCPGVESS